MGKVIPTSHGDTDPFQFEFVNPIGGKTNFFNLMPLYLFSEKDKKKASFSPFVCLFIRMYICASFVPGDSSEGPQEGLSDCAHTFRLTNC